MSDEIKVEGYCLKCKEKRVMKGPQAVWSANGAPATRGTCPVCGTNMYQRGRTPAHEQLPRPEKVDHGKSADGRAPAGKSKKRGKAARSTRRSGKLVVVESPAKAKTIGRYLGPGFTVRSSVGHVRDLLKSRLSVDIDHDFQPEYRVPNDKRKVVKDLAAAAAKASEIYLATDPDREGEAIAWHVRESAGMEPERTQRVVFQEITKGAVLEAFKHPRQIDMDRVEAQQARRVLDRLVGYKLSPLLWRKVRRGLSAGRVQSVAVRLVVEREREIDAFVPVEYWYIKAELHQQGKKPDAFLAKLHRIKGKEPELSSEEEVQPHLAALEKAAWTVGEVRLGQRTRKPSPPFTTSTLQQDASRRLNFGTSKTMRLAQQLYEGVDIGQEGTTGLITYMRTDSLTVSKEAQAQAREYIAGKFGAEYLPASAPIYKTRAKAAQEAHEAVRPTSVLRTPAALKPFLKRDQYRLYSLIWSRFVASQMAPALYDTVSADIHAGDAGTPPARRPYLFRATGSTLRFPGFLKLYEEAKPAGSEEEEEGAVPSDLARNEALDLLRLIPEQHFTQPAPRYSEATLVKALEENGVGRPSTYASIISTIQNRGYVVREERRLVPTEVGLLVNDLLVEHFPEIVSPDFTARMEDELDEIAEGKPWVPVVRAFYEPFAADLAKADAVIPKMALKKEVEYVGRACPLCGQPLVYRESRYGRFIGCSDFPTCRHTEQILVKVGVICPKDGGDLIQKRTRKGRLFYGCSNYPNCDWTNWKRPLPQPCRRCGGLVVLRTRDTAECTVCGERQPVVELASEEAAP